MAVSAKRVRVSDDSGVSWYTLPGNQAELRNEAGEIDDTIFGQAYSSTESGLIGFSVSTNALYKGFAGYVATIKQAGTPTATTGEAMSLLTGKRYQIDNAARQVWDRSASIVVYDNAVDHTADVISFDYLFGIVEFAAGYTVTGAVTIDVTYMTLAAVGRGTSFTLTQTADAIDETDFPTAQANGGYRVFTPGLKTVSLEIGGIYDVANGFIAQLEGRQEYILELNPDGSDQSAARGFFRLASQSQSGNVGALEEESVTFNLNVPDDDLSEAPFKWNHAGTTTLSQAVRIALTAWTDGTVIDAQYLPDGAAGRQGSVVVTEATITGGLEVMNEFSVTLQGVGQSTTV